MVSCVGLPVLSDSDRFRYAGFPEDDRYYWLRWLDGLNLENPTGSPTIKAYLVLLPDDTKPNALPDLAAVASAGNATTARCPVVVGSLPALQLGMVFRNGEHIGYLRMDRLEPTPLGPSCDVTLVSADAVVTTPEWANAPWTVLPASGYPLGSARDSFCLCLIHDAREVLIPASEVFRVFCAPETLLANVILSGEWKDVVDRVLNTVFCDRQVDEWLLGLRKGLTGASARVLAAYHWTAAGQAARNRLRSGLLKKDPRLQATIPYGFDGIELSGEGRELATREGTRRFLLLRISSVKFAGLHEITVPVRFRLDNYAVERSVGEREDERPSIPESVPVASGSGSQPTTISNLDPPASTTIIRRPPCEAPPMEGLPEVSRLPLDPPAPPEGERRRRWIVPEPTDMASTGIPRRGHRRVGSVAHDPVVRTSAGFAAVEAVLDALSDGGQISSWMPVVPGDWPWRTVSGLEAWDMPPEIMGRRAAFSYLADRRSRRTCLVVEIKVDEKKVYWLELERRNADEGFRYLLLRAERDALEGIVGGLLRSVTKSRGVWDRTGAGSGACLSKGFRHVYDETGAISPDAVRRSFRSIGNTDDG